MDLQLFCILYCTSYWVYAARWWVRPVYYKKRATHSPLSTAELQWCAERLCQSPARYAWPSALSCGYTSHHRLSQHKQMEKNVLPKSLSCHNNSYLCTSLIPCHQHLFQEKKKKISIYLITPIQHFLIGINFHWMSREIEKKLRQQVHPSAEVSDEVFVTQSALLTHHRNLGISKAKKNIRICKI